MSTDRLWTLVARKLAGECSPEELVELSSLLADNSDLHLQLQAIMTAWKSDKKTNMQEQDESYQKHLARLKASGFELNAVEKDNSRDIELTGTRKSPAFRRVKFVLAVAIGVTVIAFASIFLINKQRKIAA